MDVSGSVWERRRLRTIAISVVFLVSANITNAAEHRPAEVHISIVGTTVTYEGDMSRAANAKLFAQTAEAGKAITTLSISGRGVFRRASCL